MSFLRHGEIYPCDEGTISRPCPRSSPWMSLQLVIPGRLLSSRARFRFTSRSYAGKLQPRRAMLGQRTAKCNLTGCLSRGVQSIINYTQPLFLAEVAIMLWLTIVGAKERRLAAAS
jgi:hypothetical protein